MNVLLIAPATGKWQKVAKTKIFNGRTFRFSLLSLLSVAAETPKGVEVQIVDEQIDEIPWNGNFDLVGITCMTALAPRAYEIARHFIERDVPVVLGGMHPTLNSHEAIQHATAIVVGEAEGIWAKVLHDAMRGCLGGIYQNRAPLPLSGLNPPPRNLLAKGQYAAVQAVQATRGCPHGCDFCSVAAFYKKSQRQRPVEEVIAELTRIPDKFIMLVDDNLTADMDYAGKLFRALIPLNKYWVSQSTLAIADDPDFVKLAAESGCIGLFVGLETFYEKNLASVNKSCHRVEQYRKAIRLLHKNGISVEAGIVLGFDHDRPDVFSGTLQFLDELGVDLIQASVFTPLPGTPIFQKLRNRIIDLDWSNYDFHKVVFRPKGMTAEALQGGHDWLTREFYRPWRIAKRLLHQVARKRGFRTLKYLLAVNLAYYGRILNWDIRGWNPAAEKKRMLPNALEDGKASA